MHDEVPVIYERKVLREAYDMGFSKFEGSEVEPEDFEIGHYTESARYINNVAPKLRAMSGFDDAGHGTYQEPSSVVVVPPEHEDDEPMTGKVMSSGEVNNRVFEAFSNGAYDAVRDSRGELIEEVQI